MKKKTNKAKNPKRKMLIGLCIALSVILVLLIAGTAYLESVLGLIGRDLNNDTMSPEEYEEFLQNQQSDGDFTGPVLDPDDVQWGSNSDIVVNQKDVVDILIIGQDRRQGQDRQRSDVMILCTINIPKKTMTLTSFMRDMYVQIPGYKDNRINSCYQVGGAELLDKCLAENFGVAVDAHVEVDFFAFMEIIDMLGGVEMELTGSEARYLNRRGNWDVDPSTAGQWSLKEGKNLLSGQQALAFCRIRYVGNGDFERTDRQRRVISTILDMIRDKSISELNALLKKALPALTTDLSNAEIMGYVMSIFPVLSDLQTTSLRIPAEGTYQNASIRGMSVLVPDLEQNRQLIKDAVN